MVPIVVFATYLLILLAALFLARRNKYLSFGLLIFFLSTLMFSGYFSSYTEYYSRPLFFSCLFRLEYSTYTPSVSYLECKKILT